MSVSRKVVVTGTAGNLGSHLVPLLVADRFEVKGIDVAEPASPPPQGSSFEKVDLADSEAARRAIEGCDFVVHCASIFPRLPYKDHEYIDNNIKGTWNVYTAAVALGIDRIVLTSSVNAVGNVNIPPAAWPVKEESQFSFGGLYCLSKHFQEDIARHFADKGQVRTLALRPSTFCPAGEMGFGVGLLHGRYVSVDDMATAHAAAARVISGAQEPGGPLAAFEAFNTTYQPPYTQDDLGRLGPGADTAALVKMHWPKEYEWMAAHGYQGQALSAVAVYDNSKAKRLLGWEARYTFDDWFAEHAK